MNCNLAPMNSWHSWSPNGHWLAFSSKSRGPYTRLMLTHIDANGNDTPAVIIDDTTAANRASQHSRVREYAPGESIDKIDPQATDFYRLFDEAFTQIRTTSFPKQSRHFAKPSRTIRTIHCPTMFWRPPSAPTTRRPMRWWNIARPSP